MMDIKLRGFGAHSHFAGAEIIRDGETPMIVATILEPERRTHRERGPSAEGWSPADEDRWLDRVMRRARWYARGQDARYFVQIDPGRDNVQEFDAAAAIVSIEFDVC